MFEFGPGEANKINAAAKDGDQLADAVLAWYEALGRDPQNPQVQQGLNASIGRWRQIHGMENPL